ncbi:LytR/AlgR family response regulator transcription factor [Rhizosphaericola mali]|uniref:Response regulator transcription factor n=1 Tax=Rhizosphaericola mali TaxID=2545455 RepID=A0A5P2G2Q9_9BACT|nr:LytTR family DNA-binding domain-containing protein [Rhizosphaericola mali]QES88102.1 response regulator transcription factor [Rhizosphaericola mali]
MMHVLIIEDEPATARLLQSMLAQIESMHFYSVLDSVTAAIDWFNTNDNPLDLVFMDIRLSDGLSLEIFSKANITVPVIFVTAYEEYTLSAFKTTGIDYILKPFDKEELLKAVSKYKQLFQNTKPEVSNQLIDIDFLRKSLQSYKQAFLVSFRNKLLPLSVKSIAYITTVNEVSIAYVSKDKKYVLDNTLEELANLLDPKDFFRANRQFLINKTFVQDLDYYFNGRMVVNLTIPTTEKIIVSKAKVPELKKWMGL